MTEEAQVEEALRIAGTSLESFADAAARAFAEVPGDPAREGMAMADVSRLWLSKGGVVNRTQHHVEIVSSGQEPRETP